MINFVLKLFKQLVDNNFTICPPAIVQRVLHAIKKTHGMGT